MSCVMMGTKDYIVKTANIVKTAKKYIDSEKTSPCEYCDSFYIFAYMAGRFPDVPIEIVYDAVQELRGIYGCI